MLFYFMQLQDDGQAEISLNDIRLYPALIDSANSTQLDAMTAVDAVQRMVRGLDHAYTLYCTWYSQISLGK